MAREECAAAEAAQIDDALHPGLSRMVCECLGDLAIPFRELALPTH